MVTTEGVWEGAWAIIGEGGTGRGGTATGASFSTRSQAAGHTYTRSRGGCEPLLPPEDSRGRHRLLLLLRVPGSGTECFPAFLEPVQATHLRILYQGDNGQHTLRKETASTQTSNCPHAKKCETHTSYP